MATTRGVVTCGVCCYSAGAVSSGSLENSTVDLGTEFTNMIIAQRAYSATARIITTADAVLDELVRIKR